MLYIKVILFLLKTINYKKFYYRVPLSLLSSGLASSSKQRIVNKIQRGSVFPFEYKKLIALAFIPPSDVATAFDLVAGEFDDDVDDFLDYFEKTWIGEPRKRGNFFFHYHLISCFLLFLAVGRKKAQFEHQLWSIYDRVIASIP